MYDVFARPNRSGSVRYFIKRRSSSYLHDNTGLWKTFTALKVLMWWFKFNIKADYENAASLPEPKLTHAVNKFGGNQTHLSAIQYVSDLISNRISSLHLRFLNCKHFYETCDILSADISSYISWSKKMETANLVHIFARTRSQIMVLLTRVFSLCRPMAPMWCNRFWS